MRPKFVSLIVKSPVKNNLLSRRDHSERSTESVWRASRSAGLQVVPLQQRNRRMTKDWKTLMAGVSKDDHEEKACRMEDIFAEPSRPEQYWQKHEWACGDCVMRLFKEKFYGWLLSRLEQGQSALP